jgi:hypothetical protein
MSYKDLKPGRSRRLAYANTIRSNLHRHIQIQQRRELFQDIIFQSASNNQSQLYNLQTSPFYDYEILSELPTVKQSLVSKKLLQKSNISTSNKLSFCIICQQDIYLDIVRTLQCSHSYHVNCIDTWFTENNKCPQCRFEI